MGTSVFWPPTQGDQDAQCERWSLSGVTATYSNRGMLFAKITSTDVELYRDIDCGASDKVATGSHAQPSSRTKITLSASNNSGLTGSVYLLYTGADSTIRVWPTLATDSDLDIVAIGVGLWPKQAGQATWENQHQRC